MRVVWTGDNVEFYVGQGDGELRARGPTNGTRILAWGFFVSADPGSEFHVTVDDVYVTYAED